VFNSDFMSEIVYSAEEMVPLILYADNHLLAVNKPAGLLTQDSGTGLRNMEDWAREWVRADKDKAGKVFLNAVHRIDKAVSGIVLFARTSKALTRLNENIRDRKCTKIYHALVEGQPPEVSAQLVHWLLHEDHRAEISKEGGPGAQRAVLSYRRLKKLGDLSLLEVDLETGRYHQIRAQLAAIGCPIAGDTKYGSHITSPEKSIALHHAQLTITHPTRREALVLEAPYPADDDWWSRV
jgi:23S rRNA pseudouridine1911/1915/1917 synthase